ncbi:MAG: hypothetical protein LLG37_05345, partial [Spirochaetia bacterium]|nr:hypothetical protein [Spirochaetia bacterium]
EPDTKIKADFKAFIPETYMWDAAEKLRVYRRLFMARELVEVKETADYLKDAWGPLPEEVKNILFVADLRVIGRKMKLYEAAVEGSRLKLTWDAAAPADMVKKIAAKFKKIVKPMPNRVEVEFASRKEILELI